MCGAVFRAVADCMLLAPMQYIIHRLVLIHSAPLLGILTRKSILTFSTSTTLIAHAILHD